MSCEATIASEHYLDITTRTIATFSAGNAQTI